MSQQWYYAIDGMSYGPVDLNFLRQLAISENLKPSDLVWNAGEEQWKTASEINGLIQQEVVPPPLPVEKTISQTELNNRIQSLAEKDYSELSSDEYEFMVANGYSYNVPMTIGEKIGAAIIITFVVGSAIAIYKLGLFIFLILLIPILFLITTFACIYGLIAGENENKPLYLILLAASVAVLGAIFNSANSSIFRDE